MKLWLLLLSIFQVNLLGAQKIDNSVSFRDIKSSNYMRLNFDNDYFTGTDRSYTVGYNLEMVSPKIKKNPFAFLLVGSKNNASKYGLSIEHIGFTPTNIKSDSIQYGDRPFAAAIMLKSFTINTNTEKKHRLSSALTVGLIGRAAAGKEIQRGIHRSTGNPIPKGWDNQISNDVIVNYELSFEKQLFQYGDLLSIQTNTSLKVGTFFTNASFGINTTFGSINSPFSAFLNTKKMNIYFYVQPLISIVGYDATLQGGFINRNSPYTISSNAIERLTFQNNYGIVLQIKKLYVEFTQFNITKEFETGSPTKWGGFRIGYTF